MFFGKEVFLTAAVRATLGESPSPQGRDGDQSKIDTGWRGYLSYQISAPPGFASREAYKAYKLACEGTSHESGICRLPPKPACRRRRAAPKRRRAAVGVVRRESHSADQGAVVGKRDMPSLDSQFRLCFVLNPEAIVRGQKLAKGTLSYGGAGSLSDPDGVKNFIGAIFNGLSFTCTPIELLKNDASDEVACTATGFFWMKGGHRYLVTNWHVISGRNPFTGDLNPNGFIPKKIKFYGFSISIQAGIISFQRPHRFIELSDELMAKIASPPMVNEKAIDLVGIPIPKDSVFGKDPTRIGFKGSATASCFLNDHVGPRIVTNVGDDCFILGYPLQNYDGLMPPIWKRGSIASDTLIGVEGRPIFLVDAATTSGMSGSPIIRKVTTLTADNKDIGALQEFSNYELIDVYAGRLESKDLAAVNLGYAWYRTMIDCAIDYYNL